MGALRNVAWGLLVVVIDLSIDGWDLVADPVGWAMVALALGELRQLHPAFGLGAAAATAGLATSVPEWLGVSGWPVSLVIGAAELCVLFATCTAVMVLVPARRHVANRLRWWGLGLSVVLWPVFVVAKDSSVAKHQVPVALAIVAAAGLLVVFVRFLVLLFQCSRVTPIVAESSVSS